MTDMQCPNCPHNWHGLACDHKVERMSSAGVKMYFMCDCDSSFVDKFSGVDTTLAA